MKSDTTYNFEPAKVKGASASQFRDMTREQLLEQYTQLLVTLQSVEEKLEAAELLCQELLELACPDNIFENYPDR